MIGKELIFYPLDFRGSVPSAYPEIAIGKEHKGEALALADKEISVSDTLFDQIITEYVDNPPSADELERAERWRNASESEHARVLSRLLHFVEAVGRPAEKRDMFPGLLNLSPKYRARYGK